MSAVKYQTMPPLSTDEYADLENSILANGIQVPIIVDEHGVVIDGHHRKAIAEQHGLHLPSETRHMLTEAQKIDLSIQLNIARRQLNRDQKRAIVEAALKAQPERSNREHAKALGVDHKTVGTMRERLESVGEIPQLDKTVGADGKEYPASRPTPTVEDVRDIVGTYEEITVDARTGEVIEDEPTVTEHTVTEKVKTVTPKPVPTGDEANRLNAVEACQAIGNGLSTLEALTSEKRRSLILNEWWLIGKDDVTPLHTRHFTPSSLRHIAQGLIQLAKEMEAHHAYQ